MKFKRKLKSQILRKFFKGKVIILVGARQVGKSTLVEDILREFQDKSVTKLNGDDPDTRELLANRGLEFLKGIFSKNDIIFIDEAQKVPSIGNTAKLIVDFYKESKQIILTGSSSFELEGSTSESLTGRKFTFTLYPVSFEEISESLDPILARAKLTEYLVYGSYPKVAGLTLFDEKEEELDELTDSYLFRDVLQFEYLKNSQIIRDLVRALAFQIGSEVSYTELAKNLGIDRNTVIKYMSFLEKSFVTFTIPSFSRNKRREVFKSRKVYFYDLGIRNELIGNFNNLDSRSDKGALWENFIISERRKYIEYNKIKAQQYFWRTYDGAEIDYIEESAGSLRGYEIKWKKGENRRVSEKWLEYSKAPLKIINKDNFEEFISRKS